MIEREVDAPCSPLSVVVISEEREGSGHRGGEERRGREREEKLVEERRIRPGVGWGKRIRP